MTLRPLCLMVMTYGRKPTQLEAFQGSGGIDFDALRGQAYVPVIEQLGFKPVSADWNTSVLIVAQIA